MKRSTIVLSALSGMGATIVALLRWTLGSWGSTLFWLYVAGVGLLTLMAVIGGLHQRRGYGRDSLMMKVHTAGARGVLNGVGALALAIVGWPGAALAILTAWPKGKSVTLLHSAGAASASYFGVAALANAGVFGAVNLWAYRVNSHAALQFAWLWGIGLLGFLSSSALLGTRLSDTIRQSPGPVVPRLVLSALGSLAGLVSAIAISDAHNRAVVLDFQLLQSTARRILTFKKVAESFFEGGVPPFTTTEWLETAAGALYYWVVSNVVLKAKRKDEDHFKVGVILIAAGRPQEALVHARKILQATSESKCLEATALLGVGRREEAMKLAGEAAQMGLDPRTPEEVLSESLAFPSSTSDDARYFLKGALDANVPDGRVTLLLPAES